MSQAADRMNGMNAAIVEVVHTSHSPPGGPLLPEVKKQDFGSGVSGLQLRAAPGAADDPVPTVAATCTTAAARLREQFDLAQDERSVSKYRVMYRSQSVKQHVQVLAAFNRFCDSVGRSQNHVTWVGEHTDEHEDKTDARFEWLDVLKPFLRDYDKGQSQVRWMVGESSA